MKALEQMNLHEMGKLFELFLLKPCTEQEIDEYVDRAIQYNLRSVIVSHHWAKRVGERLKGTGIKLGGGGSFPFGSDLPATKELIALQCMEMGYEDIEITLNYSALRYGNAGQVEEEVERVRSATQGAELKFVIECCALNDDQIRQACKILTDHKVDFAKSSTGQIKGPTLEQACLIVDSVRGTATHSKVSGVTFPKPQNALFFLMAGIEVIGSQNPFEILDGIRFIRERGIVPGPVN